MSYNISSWKTKRLEQLVIPLKSLSENAELTIKGEETIITVPLSEGRGVVGILADKNLLVREINLYGEFSGSDYRYVLLPALRESMGFLEAVLIWERSDSITRLTVKDGEVVEENVEL